MSRPIIITGGPCGGKTTIIQWLACRLPRLGYKTVLIPEAARMAISILGPARTDREKLELQVLIVRLQLAMEDAVTMLAAKGTVILEDRGILDSPAYLNPRQWGLLQTRIGCSASGIRRRYRAAIHLTSCAVDKPERFRLDRERTETMAQARRIDRRILASWREFGPVQAIDNQGKSLRAKREETLRTVLDILRTGD